MDTPRGQAGPSQQTQSAAQARRKPSDQDVGYSTDSGASRADVTPVLEMLCVSGAWLFIAAAHHLSFEEPRQPGGRWTGRSDSLCSKVGIAAISYDWQGAARCYHECANYRKDRRYGGANPN